MKRLDVNADSYDRMFNTHYRVLQMDLYRPDSPDEDPDKVHVNVLENQRGYKVILETDVPDGRFQTAIIFDTVPSLARALQRVADICSTTDDGYIKPLVLQDLLGKPRSPRKTNAGGSIKIAKRGGRTIRKTA